MLANVTDKVEKEIVFHPVVVVAYLGAVDGVVKIEELAQLLADTADVVLHFLDSKEFALGSLERGVANHACGTAHNGQGLMPGHLQVLEKHDAHQVSNMERVGGGVDADIGSGYFFVELFFCAGHDVVNHATPFEFLYEVCLH